LGLGKGKKYHLSFLVSIFFVVKYIYILVPMIFFLELTTVDFNRSIVFQFATMFFVF